MMYTAWTVLIQYGNDPDTLDKLRTYFGSEGETWRIARMMEEYLTNMERKHDFLPNPYLNFVEGWLNVCHNRSLFSIFYNHYANGIASVAAQGSERES